MSKSEVTATRKPYNKTYYDTHRDQILERKRLKYRENPEYREASRNDSRRRRANKSMGTTMVEVSGEMVAAHQISEFAKMIGKSPSTVNFWQRHGTIPPSPFRTPGGFRLYTDAMAHAVKRALEDIKSPPRGDQKFCAVVTTLWAEAGIPVSVSR